MLDMHRKKSVQVLLSTSKFIIIRCENDDHPLQINPGLCVFTIYWWKILVENAINVCFCLLTKILKQKFPIKLLKLETMSIVLWHQQSKH